MKIKKNPDEELYNRVTQAVIDNGYYCPCKLNKTEDTKCICKEFIESQVTGACHCGRYIKEEV